jgi:cytochrome c-type biogenesis protein CcmH/NrfG
MAVDHDTLSANRLDSWKEIAAFLGRAERTVKRWEAERGLPVHRLPGGGRSAVFAYKNELAEWLKQPAGEVESGEVPVASLDTSQQDAEAVLPAADPFQAKPIDAEPAARRRFHLAAAAWSALAALALVLIVLSAGGGKFWPLRRASQRAANAEAQELYLKGRYFWNRRTPEDLNKAIEYFTQAIVKDPGEAQAYVGLADCYNLLPEFGAMPPGEAYPRAMAAAQRAVALDEKSAEAHNSLAFPTFWWSWQAATAEREFKRALQLNPNFVRGHHWYATYLLAMHRYPEALDQMEQAQRLDPASPAILADKGLLLWSAGRHAEGLALLKQLEASEPSLSSPHYFLARIFEQQGDYPAAIQEWQTLAELRHDEAGAKIAAAAAQGYAAGGVRGLLESRLPLQKEIVDRGDGSAYELAATYAALNRKEEALAYLQIAYDRRDQDLLGGDPPIPALNDEPAYRKLQAQIAARLAE